MAVYILEAEREVGDLDKAHGRARYYVGWTLDHMVDERIATHMRGRGSHFTRYVVNVYGVQWRLVALFEGGKTTERWIKNLKDTPSFMRKLRAGKTPKGCPTILMIDGREILPEAA